MRHTLPTLSPVLAIIEEIGLAEYLGLAALAYTPTTQPGLWAAVARRAQRSLLLRLLVRRPLRSRDLCQLQIGHTLQYEAGVWQMTLPAEGGGARQSVGRQAADRISFPDDLAQPLVEFLDLWRPMLDVSDQAALFIIRAGLSYTASALNDEVGHVIWRYTRWSVSLPQIRQLQSAEFAARFETTQPLPLGRQTG